MGEETTTEPLDDTAAADWLVSAIPDFHGRVIDLVTDTFPAYARIFHRPDQGLAHSDRPSSWAAMAEDRGTVFPPRPEQQPTRREGPDVAY